MRKALLMLVIGGLIISGLVACTHPAEPATVPADYFPVGVNNMWDYLGEGNEYASYIMEMPFVKNNQAQTYVDNGGTVAAEIFQIDDNAIIRVFFAGEQYEQENMLESGFTANDQTVILKSPLKKGTVWKNDKETREIAAIDAQVDTPAGNFSDCLKIKITNADSTSIVYQYYAAGVGMVKREFIDGDFIVTSTLQEYNIVSGQ
ncbi:MAG: hypothetical protein PHD40_06695 [Syntrophomonadaceae bacterium]|nr:hypothetical protein [Syntrophomonadaceae bacterium]